MIYLDHNATTPCDPRVVEAMLPWLAERFGNPSSPHRFGAEARTVVEASRARLAACVGCGPDEIVFCGSGTEADNLALRGATRALAERGRHVVTTAIEHHAVLHTCRDLELCGFRVTFLPPGRGGAIDADALAASLQPDTVLVSVMHANNETGVIQPVDRIAALTRARGIALHVDAVQTAGKLPGRLADLGADLVAISAHKLCGPKGVGALYVRRGTPLAPLITGGSHERGLRAGTENVAAIVGFAAAMELACAEAGAEGTRLGALRDRLEREVVAAVPGTLVNGVLASRVPNTSNMAFEGVDGESVVLGLDLAGVCASTGSACSTGEPEPSHVLLAMGLTPREAQGAVRLSLGRGTTGAGIDAAVRALVETIARLRAISSVA
jgi:cysteine desulfurase